MYFFLLAQQTCTPRGTRRRLHADGLIQNSHALKTIHQLPGTMIHSNCSLATDIPTTIRASNHLTLDCRDLPTA